MGELAGPPEEQPPNLAAPRGAGARYRDQRADSERGTYELRLPSSRLPGDGRGSGRTAVGEFRKSFRNALLAAKLASSAMTGPGITEGFAAACRACRDGLRTWLHHSVPGW